MAHARPIVCSRIGGLPEIVSDEIHGLLYEPGNTADLVEKIRRLWDNPNLCKVLGETGQKQLTKRYGADVVYDQLEEAYRTAIRATENRNKFPERLR